MNQQLKDKLKELPSAPGVYFHKDKSGEIIYVGKAAVLKNRVRQYFQKSKNFDAKTSALVSEISDVDWIVVDSEIDALFLESEMVKRYMPKFNVLLRDDKSSTYIRINMNDEVPYISFTRNPLDDKAEYFGPYYSAGVVKNAMRFLRKVFPYYVQPYKEDKPSLDFHIGLTPGIEVGKSTPADYKANLRKLIRYIKGERATIIKGLKRDMDEAAAKQDFEKATELRNQYFNLLSLSKQVLFGDKEHLDITKDQALTELKNLLGLQKVPTQIEGYDISHMSGTNVVASMVVFKNGVSDRSSYRKFKLRIDRNDDTANMKEVLTRRLSQKNLKAWGKPDLVIIDGGVQQLSAVADALSEQNITFIGRNKSGDHGKNAKVQLVIPDGKSYRIVYLTSDSHLAKLVARIDDEAHRFAVSYHTVLKRKSQTKSVLDDMYGIGAKTKSKLLKKYGSVAKIKSTSEADLAAEIGASKAKLVKEYLG